MIAAIAIVAALLFVGSALYRFAPRAPRSIGVVALVAALTAGALGIANWSVVGDSRWLVGGLLLLGAAYPGYAAGNRRALMIAALVCGVLGAGLYGIATSHPPVRPIAPA